MVYIHNKELILFNNISYILSRRYMMTEKEESQGVDQIRDRETIRNIYLETIRNKRYQRADFYQQKKKQIFERIRHSQAWMIKLKEELQYLNEQIKKMQEIDLRDLISNKVNKSIERKTRLLMQQRKLSKEKIEKKQKYKNQKKREIRDIDVEMEIVVDINNNLKTQEEKDLVQRRSKEINNKEKQDKKEQEKNEQIKGKQKKDSYQEKEQFKEECRDQMNIVAEKQEEKAEERVEEQQPEFEEKQQQPEVAEKQDEKIEERVEEQMPEVAEKQEEKAEERVEEQYPKVEEKQQQKYEERVDDQQNEVVNSNIETPSDERNQLLSNNQFSSIQNNKHKQNFKVSSQHSQSQYQSSQHQKQQLVVSKNISGFGRKQSEQQNEMQDEQISFQDNVRNILRLSQSKLARMNQQKSQSSQIPIFEDYINIVSGFETAISGIAYDQNGNIQPIVPSNEEAAITQQNKPVNESGLSYQQLSSVPWQKLKQQSEQFKKHE